MAGYSVAVPHLLPNPLQIILIGRSDYKADSHRSIMARPKYKDMFNHATSIIAELQREILRQRRLIDDLLSGDLEPEDD